MNTFLNTWMSLTPFVLFLFGPSHSIIFDSGDSYWDIVFQIRYRGNQSISNETVKSLAEIFTNTWIHFKKYLTTNLLKISFGSFIHSWIILIGSSLFLRACFLLNTYGLSTSLIFSISIGSRLLAGHVLPYATWSRHFCGKR